MRLRTKKWLLYSTSVVLLAVGGFAVVWGGRFPLPPDTINTKTSPASPVAKQVTATASRPNLEQFRQVWNKRLRRPLVDPAPQVPAVPTPSPRRARRPVTLLGTMVEPGASMAVLMTQPAGVQVLAVGQPVGQQSDAPKVSRITALEVDLDYGDEVVTLKLDNQ